MALETADDIKPKDAPESRNPEKGHQGGSNLDVYRLMQTGRSAFQHLANDAANLLLPGLQIEGGKSESSTIADVRKKAAATFTKDEMSAFDENAGKFEKRADAEKLSPEIRAGFVKEIGRLVDASKAGNERFSSAEIKGLAIDVLHSAAVPGDVNQGKFPTCAPAALASVLNKSEPNLVAGLVADLAIDGRYVMKDGTVMTPPVKSLKPDPRQTDESPNGRTKGDHLAQVALVDMYWNRQEQISKYENWEDKRGKLFYEEGHPKDFIGDHGVRIMDYSGKVPKPVTEEKSQSHSKLPDFPGAQGTVERVVDSPLMTIGNLRDIYDQLRNNNGSLGLVDDVRTDKRTISPESAADFKKKLEDGLAGKPGGITLPAVVGVYTKSGAFFDDRVDLTLAATKTDQNDRPNEPIVDYRKRRDTGHAVAMFDYDPATGLATVENQWGNQVDHTGKPGSKAKMRIDDLLRSIDAETPEKQNEKPPASSREEWIKAQKDFIEELSKDDRIKPEKMFEEKLSLHELLKMGNQNAEATKLEDELLSTMKQRFAGLDGQDSDLSRTNFKDAQKLLKMLSEGGRNKDAGEFVSELTQNFAQTADQPMNIRRVQTWSSLLDLGKTSGSADAHKSVASAIFQETQSSEFGGGDDSTRRAKHSILEALADRGFKVQAGQLFDSFLQEQEQIDQGPTKTSSAALSNKANLIGLCEDVDRKEIATRLTRELQTTLDTLKASGSEESLPGRMYARHALARQYTDNRDVGKLLPILRDSVEAFEKSPAANDEGPRGPDHPTMLGMLKRTGENLCQVGEPQKALEYFHRALDISKKIPDREEFDTHILAEKLCSIYKGLGQQDKAHAIATEFGIKRY